MTPIRLVQVGMGGWGQDWARVIAQHHVDVEVVACVDMQADALERFRERHDFPVTACFSSLEGALEQVDADAVLVTTSLPGHVPVALAALNAGKHVLVEKPFAPSLADAQRVVDVAAAQKRIVMVSQNYRFYPAVQAVAKLVREQKLGMVGAVDVRFRKYANTKPRGESRYYDTLQPLLMDMAIHHFDLMRYVVGQEPVRVSCHAWNPPWSNFRDSAAASAIITFDGGAVVNYQGNWVSTAPGTTWAGDWRVECEGGEIAWTSRDDRTTDADRVTLRPRGGKDEHLELQALTKFDRAGSLAAFAAAVRAGTEPEASGRDNLGSLGLMFATVAAAKSGQPQAIPSGGLAIRADQTID